MNHITAWSLQVDMTCMEGLMQEVKHLYQHSTSYPWCATHHKMLWKWVPKQVRRAGQEALQTELGLTPEVILKRKVTVSLVTSSLVMKCGFINSPPHRRQPGGRKNHIPC
jgi:hypothetical protein